MVLFHKALYSACSVLLVQLQLVVAIVHKQKKSLKTQGSLNVSSLRIAHRPALRIEFVNIFTDPVSQLSHVSQLFNPLLKKYKYAFLSPFACRHAFVYIFPFLALQFLFCFFFFVYAGLFSTATFSVAVQWGFSCVYIITTERYDITKKQKKKTKKNRKKKAEPA